MRISDWSSDVCSSDLSRSEFAPEVPTFKEQGINLINGSQRGFVAPAGLPPEVKAKLLDAFRKAAADPKLLAALKATANPAEVVVGDDFRKLNAETLDLAKEVWKATQLGRAACRERVCQYV